MALKDLYTTEAVVKEILEQNVKARQDDMYLYYKYCEKQTNQTLAQWIFTKIFIDKEFRRASKIREYKSVERIRRKIQAKYPHLRDEKVAKMRYEQQDIYKDYAMH